MSSALQRMYCACGLLLAAYCMEIFLSASVWHRVFSINSLFRIFAALSSRLLLLLQALLAISAFFCPKAKTKNPLVVLFAENINNKIQNEIVHTSHWFKFYILWQRRDGCEWSGKQREELLRDVRVSDALDVNRRMTKWTTKYLFDIRNVQSFLSCCRCCFSLSRSLLFGLMFP